jgi:hypothetical protein
MNNTVEELQDIVNWQQRVMSEMRIRNFLNLSHPSIREREKHHFLEHESVMLSCIKLCVKKATVYELKHAISNYATYKWVTLSCFGCAQLHGNHDQIP